MGASKEALIQLRLMNDKLKEARDAGEALEKNVRVSTLVSTFFRQKFCVVDVFEVPSGFALGEHPLGVCGGTQSAPTGWSP